jgi:hypothetical protein
MNGLTTAAIALAATFFFATVLSLNLAVAIYRRAEKSLLVDNLVVILLFFAVESATSLSYVIYGTGGWLDERARHLLVNGAYSVRIVAVAVIVYFILSATRRMIGDSSIQFPVAPALLVIARSKALHRFFVLALFASACAAIGDRIWRTLSVMPNVGTGRIQLPPSFLEKPVGIVIAFLGGISVLAQCLTIAYARYTCMPGQTKTRRLGRFLAGRSAHP